LRIAAESSHLGWAAAHMDRDRALCVRTGPTLALWLSMTTFSDSKSLLRIDDAEDPNTELGLASSTSRSFGVPGTQASGTIVFSSLCIMAGLGVAGLFGLHAYVHRDDPPLSVDALPAASPAPQLAVFLPQVSSARLTAAPSADAPAVAPSEPISAPAVSKTSRPTVVAETADKPGASESASDNPY
jgi:hypothetical protein